MEILALGIFGIIAALLAWTAYTVSLQARLGACERDRDEWKVRAEAAEGALASYRVAMETVNAAEADARGASPGTIWLQLQDGAGKGAAAPGADLRGPEAGGGERKDVPLPSVEPPDRRRVS